MKINLDVSRTTKKEKMKPIKSIKGNNLIPLRELVVKSK